MKLSKKQNHNNKKINKKPTNTKSAVPEGKSQTDEEFERIYRDLKDQMRKEKQSEREAAAKSLKSGEPVEKKLPKPARVERASEPEENGAPDVQHGRFKEVEAENPKKKEDLSEFDDAGYSYDEADEVFPGTFSAYVSSMLATFGVRRIRVNPEYPDMLPGDDELGKEVNSDKASKYYGSYMGSLNMRFKISLVFLVLLAYLTFDFPRFGMMKDYGVTALCCMAIQLLIMLLSLDILTNGFCQLFSFRFTGDTLAFFSCIVTIADAISIYCNQYLYTPRCLISSFSLVGLLWASGLNAKALKKSFRVPAISKRAYGICSDTKIISGDWSAVKSMDYVKGFVRGAEEEAPDEEAYSKFSAVILLCAFMFSAAVTVIKKESFLHMFATVLSPAVPFGMLLAFAMPFYVISTKLFPFGAAVAGWSGFNSLSKCDNIVIGDTDIFPESAVNITGVRVFADDNPSRIIAYAGCILQMSGSVLAGCFDDLMDKNNCREYTVRNFKPLPGGGLRAIIDGHTVLCGGVEIMRLMKIKLPFRLVSETSVLLAVDNTLSGIFDIEYTPLPSVQEALLNLNQSGTHPVFAVKDFNITPELIAALFDVRTDSYDFPPYEQRFSLAKDSDAPAAAVVCTEGLRPYINALDYSARITGLVKVNVLMTLFSSFFALLLFFLLSLFSPAAGGVSAAIMIAYMLVSFIPILVTALLLSR